MTGPLAGVRVLEVDGIGASPFTHMLLADMGADVVRVQRPGLGAAAAVGVAPGSVMLRGRQAVLPLDLKDPDGLATLLALADAADVVTEAFRPGVAERLGIGPDVLRDRNPRLVYGRMTGWGREGPLARAAGHDITYIAVAGVLGALGRPDSPPPPPLALAGDMGGGGLFLALGILAALLERERSGRGQVVDAAMVDGAAVLMAAFWEHWGAGRWTTQRGANMVDGGLPWYDTYACADGRYVAVGALEPPFFAALVDALCIEPPADRDDPACWPVLRAALAAAFATRTRDEWAALLEDTDACVAPVLDFTDASTHRHNLHRGTFTEVDGVTQPAPAPRFSRTPSAVRAAPAPAGDGSTGDLPSVLAGWGLSVDDLPGAAVR